VTGLRIRKSGAIKGVIARVRTSGGLKDVEAGYLRRSGALKQFYALGGSGDAFDLSLSPSDVVGYAATPGSASVFTQSCAAVPSGGLAPYTYAWSVTAGSGGTWTAETPAASSTVFKCTGVGESVSYDATISCTVTDARGFSVTTGGTAYVENFGGLWI
jgi:hypothetical protein